MGRKENIAALRRQAKEIPAGRKWVVDHFRPEDALGVALCYLAIYGEDFPIDSCYDPEAIREANTGPDMHTVVARTEEGDIVGMAALFRAVGGGDLFEVGGSMVLPAYRGPRMAVRMNEVIMEELVPALGLAGVYGQPVSTQTFTQKLGLKYNSPTTGLELEVLEAQADGGAASGGRPGSLFFRARIYRDAPRNVHVPDVYADLFRVLYDSLGCERSFLPGGEPGAAPTAWAATDIGQDGPSRMNVSGVGADAAEALAAFEARRPGRRVLQVALPLGDAGCPAMAAVVRERGYRLAGLLPLWAAGDVLLLQKLAVRPDFDALIVVGEDSQRMVDAIRADMAS